MASIIAFLIVAVAVIAITYKTYVGYGEYGWGIKICLLLFLLIGWSAPFISHIIRHSDVAKWLLTLSDILYILWVFVALLFVISFVRDTIWMLITAIRRLPMESMDNPELLLKLNLGTIVLCVLLCGYGVYEGTKEPVLKTYDIVSQKIKKPTKVVMLADTHIDVNVSPQKVKKLVDRVNGLHPDAIVMVGDIIDNYPAKLYHQMNELKKLKAPYGRYITLGNHEFYAGARDWAMTFAQAGLDFLNNIGVKVADTGLYIAGIPDIPSAQMVKMPIKIDNALYKASKEDYVILLSHSPKIAEGLTAENTDLQLSGHTHGGQVFPFHYFVKKANDGALAGFYDKKGIKLYVSRGTGYWGPAMRILAPSEITVFNFMPEKKSAK